LAQVTAAGRRQAKPQALAASVRGALICLAAFIHRLCGSCYQQS
jgi:hypothetical protein